MTAATTILGAPPLAGVWARLRAGVRVLAYHGVPDRPAFRAQLDHLVRNYRPVSAEDVVRAAGGLAPLPARAVWVTFDDGSLDVVEHGLPELLTHRIKATLFVCPAVIGTEDPLWWQTVDRAFAHGLAPELAPGSPARVRLKRCPDDERRAVVVDLADALARRAIPNTAPQLDWRDLERCVDAGHTVGNHSWDHPCLDRCSLAAQEAQVGRAHDALARYASEVNLFAYPNGDWAAGAERALLDRSYDLAVLFDHRIASATDRPLRTSRLRIDSDAPLARFRAVVSGAHSSAFALSNRLRRRAG